MCYNTKPLSWIIKKGGEEYKTGNTEIAGKWLIFQWNEWAVEEIANEFIQNFQPKKDIDVTGVFCDSYAKEQPRWSLEEPEEYYYRDDYREKERRRLCERVDLIGWYVPVHLNPNEYGIHFDVGSVLRLAQEFQNMASTSGSMSYKDWVMVAIETIFWHEVTHAWIEDLASLAEWITGVDYYTQTYKRYGAYIFMEEALCNSAAMGMLKVFFKRRPNTEQNLIFDVVKRFMRQQPKGYRNFIELDWWATNESVFITNMYYLLKRVYHVPFNTAKCVVPLFFGHICEFFDTPPFRPRFPNLELERYFDIYMRYDKYPMHLH